MLSISIQRKDGTMKDTARNIKKTKQFVIHIVDEANVAEVNKTAANLPAQESEIDLTNFTLVPSSEITVPAVKESKARFECELVQTLELGEAGQIGCDFIIGRILAYHFDESVYEDGKINPHILKAISRLAGNDYAKIGDIFTMERPI